MEEDLRPYVSKLSGDPKVDYDALLREIGDAKVVMFGGSTHGTHEFCEERDRITKRLIEEKGFSYVLCEADWPDMERVHRYVRGLGEDKSAVEALAGFQRFPEWMWRNQVMVDFVEWAFLHNKKVFAGEANRNTHPVSLYGLDLHSLNKSIDSVNCYLELVDPSAARRARQSYSCFDEFRHDPASYGLAAGHADCRTCEKQVLEVLLDVLKMAPENLRCDGNQRDYRCCEDLSFNAIQNALVVKDAEAYYRAMFRGSGVSAWNIRDRHMFDVIVALIEHCERVCGWESKVVVWAHNCHVSDARTSEVSWRWNEINVGQLVKEKFGGKAFSVGFSTYSGYLTSAPYWGGPARRMRLKPAVEGSFCHLLHEVSEPRFILDGAKNKLRDLQCLKRSIGVIYRPETERESHYFEAKVVQQFDETIYLDQTTALEPLDGKDEWASDADGPDQQPE